MRWRRAVTSSELLQSHTAVAAYLKSKQLLLSAFVEYRCRLILISNTAELIVTPW